MSTIEQAEKAHAVIGQQLGELVRLVDAGQKNEDAAQLAEEKLGRWVQRTEKLLRLYVSEAEADRFHALANPGFYFGTDDACASLMADAERYGVFLVALRDEIREHAEHVFSAASPPSGLSPQVGAATARRSSAPPQVFIVHGHDEVNTLRLEKLLEKRWKLQSIVLRDKPGRGRTIIEKFEQEASTAAFAFVLLTADDLVRVSDAEYQQSRPNVLFELGWFFGQLGRDRVCLLRQAKAKIPTDLDGISRIDFDADIDSKVKEIEEELRHAGLL